MIVRYDPQTNKSEIFTNDSGKANGMFFDAKGNLITCEGSDEGGRRVSKWNVKTKERTTLADRYMGKRFNAPNDLTIDRQGRIYFTDPRYLGTEPRELEHRAVYRIDADGKVVEVTHDISKPNGIALSPDDKTLYVLDHDNGTDQINPKGPQPKHGRMALDAFPLGDDGLVHGEKRTLIDWGDQAGGDGMTVDSKGNIYIADRSVKRPGVRVTDPKGKEIGFIPTGEPDQKIDADHPGKGFPEQRRIRRRRGKEHVVCDGRPQLVSDQAQRPRISSAVRAAVTGVVPEMTMCCTSPPTAVGGLDGARGGCRAGTRCVCGPVSRAEGPKATPPRDAVKTFKIAEGLDVRLVASEPLIRQPLSISFDDRGRLWLLQYIQYPIPEGLHPVAVDEYLRTKYDRRPDPPPKGPRGHDVIAILEDTDGDGVYDRAKPFLTGLNLASGWPSATAGCSWSSRPICFFIVTPTETIDPTAIPRSCYRFRDGGRACLRQFADLGTGRLALRSPRQHSHARISAESSSNRGSGVITRAPNSLNFLPRGAAILGASISIVSATCLPAATPPSPCAITCKGPTTSKDSASTDRSTIRIRSAISSR